MPRATEPSPIEQVWIDALVDRYFKTDFKGRPVYLAVDEDELNEISASLNLPTTSLVEEVVASLSPRGEPFQNYMIRWNRWQPAGSDPPPFLSLLAVCVLAASMMGRDDQAQIHANDYYSRLNALLGLPEDAGAPDGFERLSHLWRTLGKWLADDLAGSRGNPMLEEPEWFTHIGWPISQSIFRAVDRFRLPECFVASDLAPGDDVTSDQLYQRVRRWAQADHHFSKRGTQMLREATGKIELQLKEIVLREFKEWDGTLRDATGRKRGPVHLLMLASGGSHSFEFIPSKPESFPDEFVSVNPPDITLQQIVDGYYEKLPYEVNSSRLTDGFSLTRQGFNLSFRHGGIIPLGENMDIEGWLSVPRVSLGEPYCVLVHASQYDSVRRYLREFAHNGTQEPLSPKALPDGWFLYKNLTFKPSAKSEIPELRCLVPRSDATSQLQGGLKLSATERIYLRNCEPTLVVSTTESTKETVELDNRTMKLSGGKLDLAALKLDAGPHMIKTGDITLRFESVESLNRLYEPVEIEIAHRLVPERSKPLAVGAVRIDVGTERQPGESRVVGAYSELNTLRDYQPVFARIAFESFTAVGSRVGEIARFERPPFPEWLRNVKAPGKQSDDVLENLAERTQRFETYMDFKPTWVVESRDGTAQIVRVLDLDPSIERVGSTEDAAQWSEVIESASKSAPLHRPKRDSELWAKYVSVANSVNAS